MLRINIRPVGIKHKLSWLMLPAVVFALFLNVSIYGVIAVDSTARLDEATSYLSRDQYTQAEQLYREVSEQNPGTDVDLRARKGLAIAYAAQKKDSDVDVVVDRLIREFSSHQETTQAVCNVGDQYFSKQDFARARQLFSRTVNDCPRNSFSMWAQCGIASSSIRLGDDAAAEAAIAKLIADYSEQDEIAMAASKVAENYYQLNKRAKADVLYQVISEKWPHDEFPMWSRMYLTISDIKQGEDAVAEAATAKLIADYSEQKDIAIAVCVIAEDYYKLNNRTRGDSLYKMVAENWPQHDFPVWSGMRLAMSYIDEGDMAMAELIVDSMFTNHSNHQHFIRAVCYIAGRYYDRQEFDKASQLYQRITDKHPEATQAMWPQIISLIANLRLTDNDITIAAIDKIQADHASHPELPEAISWLAEIYYKEGTVLQDGGSLAQARGRFKKAISIWEKNINQTTDSGHQCLAHYHSAIAHQHIKDYNKAIEFYNKVVTQWPGHEKAWIAQFRIIRCLEMLYEQNKIPIEEVRKAHEALVSGYPDCPASEASKRWLVRNK